MSSELDLCNEFEMRLTAIEKMPADAKHYSDYYFAWQACMKSIMLLDALGAKIAYDRLAGLLYCFAGNPANCLDNPAAYLLRAMGRTSPLDARDAWIYNKK